MYARATTLNSTILSSVLTDKSVSPTVLIIKTQLSGLVSTKAVSLSQVAGES